MKTHGFNTNHLPGSLELGKHGGIRLTSIECGGFAGVEAVAALGRPPVLVGGPVAFFVKTARPSFPMVCDGADASYGLPPPRDPQLMSCPPSVCLYSCELMQFLLGLFVVRPPSGPL